MTADFSAGGNGVLKATATQIGDWEMFYTPTNPGENYATYFNSTVNYRYVSADLSGAAPVLKVGANSAGAWEEFTW